jgi:uncharacterized membrane protein YcfT
MSLSGAASSGWFWTLMDLPAARGPRTPWADTAKAFSMILLVAWTLLADRIYLNEMLMFVRMPLFFFVSGLFAHRAVTATSFRDLLRDKFTNFLYLYALWEIILFAFRAGVLNVVRGRPADPTPLLNMFWDPIFNIWFLYALALAFLAAWLLRNAPALLVLAAATVLYCISVASGEWRFLPFIERVIRLFPFFWLGLILRPRAQEVIGLARSAWPLLAASFLGVAYFLVDSRLNAIGPLTFALSLTGIAALAGLAHHLSAFPGIQRPLAFIGASTLYIYVMHKVAIFYLVELFRKLGLQFQGDEILLLVIVVPACAIVGRWAARRRSLAWLFAAPWVRPQQRAPRLATA